MRISDWSSDVCSSELQLLGKIRRLTLDGKAAPGNPMYDAGGVRAMTWSTGLRNPYGLAFAPDGTLWETEMGPRGGDELNVILPGKNYGYPVVSNGDNYSGQRSEEHTSELQSLMRISYAVFCLKKKKKTYYSHYIQHRSKT